MECPENNANQTAALEQMNNAFVNKVLPVTVFIGVEIVIGFLGNLAMLYIFIFRYHACNFRTFVICLTVIDFICTVTTMPGEMVTQSYWFIYPFPKICKTKDFFNVFTVFAETLCLLVIAIDRYRKVCCPLAWQIQSNVAVVVCVCIVLAASFVAAPVTLFWGTLCKIYAVPEQNITVTARHCEKDQDYKDTTKPFAYEAVVGSIVFIFLVAMFLMYIRVARALIRNRKEGVAQAPLALRIRKKTIIMIILTACFMITTVLYYIMICLLGSADDIFEKLSSERKVVFLFFLRFYFIQHIINPILYALLDPTVKEAIGGMRSSAGKRLSRTLLYLKS